MAALRNGKKKIALNIYLLKPNPARGSNGKWSQKDFIAKPVGSSSRARNLSFDKFPVGNNGELGWLYIRKPHSSSTPEWVAFVRNQLPDPASLDKLKNKSISAILVVTRAARQFAIAFGHGRYMLDQKCIEDRFGIKTVLNSISPEKISSIDRQTFDASPRISRTQAIKATSLSDYVINAEQDLLRALVGLTKPDYSAKLGDVLAGMDSLKTAVAIESISLGDLLDIALERSQSGDYLAPDANGNRSEFAWVDNLKSITDRSTIESLEKNLWNKFRSKDFSTMWLAIPEIIDWTEVTGFVCSKSRVDEDDVDDYLDIRRLRDSFRKNSTIETLKNRNILMIMSTGAQPKSFKAYKCLYAEIRKETDLFILNAGAWYHVKPSFRADVQAYFDGLPSKPFTLPFMEYSHSCEGAYNEAVSRASPATYAMLDRKLIQFGGAHGRVEVCDLFRPTATATGTGGEFIHVKRGRGSATLSHLFAQGLVSSSLMVREPGFVAQVNKQLAAQRFSALPENFTAAGYEVVYAVIDGPEGTELDIPFFSKVNLENCGKSIAAYGYKVSLMHIPESRGYLTVKAAAKEKKREKIGLRSESEALAEVNSNISSR